MRKDVGQFEEELLMVADRKGAWKEKGQRMNHMGPRVLPRSVPIPGASSERERYETSVHEGKHASYASYTGSRVLEVDVMRQFTRCRFAFNTSGALWFA
jgi:hypothetical protein